MKRYVGMGMVRRLLMGSVFDERRSTSYQIVFGIWAMVAVYAIAHDQYVVGIAPEHFTVYHAPVWNLTGARALAAAWAFKASLVPGLLLGFAALLVGRRGARPRIRVRRLLLGAGLVIMASELVAAGSGFWVHQTGRGIFPDQVYPDLSGPMMVTQTIQITCYLASAGFSALWLVGVALWRRRQG
jgi:hypothetical protein